MGMEIVSILTEQLDGLRARFHSPESQANDGPADICC